MKLNIAISGTFDVENYGDVMFPVVFKKAMEKRGLDFELFLFSPGPSIINPIEPETKVYSISEIEKVHKEHPLDAIVIGGGALIHFNKIPVKMPESDEFIDYNIHDSWYSAISFAVRNNVKVLFNLPQVPYEFPVAIKDVVISALDSLQYVSVRDDVSKKYIHQLYDNSQMPEVSVYPDSVCCINELISADYLAELKNTILPSDKKYAVIQFNPQRPEEQSDDLFEIINRLKNYGLEIVLLPLGYTHNDDGVLKDYNSKYGNSCITIDKKLTIFEMAAVLAGCEIYIGASFHGAITAIAYGKKAISYNYITPKTKNIEIFNMYNVGNFVAEDAKGVLSILDDLLAEKVEFAPDTQAVTNVVNEHFDILLKHISADSKPQYDKDKFFAALQELLPRNILLENDVEQRCQREVLVENHIKNLTDINDSKDTHISTLSKDIAEKEDTIAKLNTTVENLFAIKANLEQNNRNLELHAATLQNQVNEISNSFFWRLTKPLRVVSQKGKNFVTRNSKLLIFAIFMKGFLRGGPRRAKLQVENYKRFMGVTNEVKTSSFEISKKERAAQESTVFEKDIKFSILVPLYNTPTDFLEEMMDSVFKQTYSNWELCLADGSDNEHAYVGKYCLKKAKKDSRIKYKRLEKNEGISENTNACLDMATGDYIALFDHDDVLHHSVLFEYMKVICEQGADFIYCDEDKFTEYGGKLTDANYKPDFAIDNLRSNNYICHFTVFDKKLIAKAGKFRKEFDGSQDHDIILRLTEQAKKIVHIPKVLYHWRVNAASVASDPYAKPYTIEAGRKAVREHLERVGLKGTVESTTIHPNIYRIKYDIIGNPLVSIIIPNYNHIEELSRCINSIIEKTTYSNYEIIIVENNSNEETFAYYETLKKYEQIKVVVYKPEGGFNYSAINNYGVQFASGEHYVLLNNDVEIITPEWIEEMLMYSQRDDVGAVGAMLYYPNDTIQHAGITIGVLTLAGHNFKHSPRGNCGYFGRAGYQQDVSAVTAACLMLPKSVYEEVGGLDESFAVAFNDVDLCMRIRKAGHLIVFTPFAELYHYESISRGSDNESDEKRQRFVSEVLRFQKRWKKELEAGDPYYNPNLTLDREDFSPK